MITSLNNFISLIYISYFKVHVGVHKESTTMI